MSYSMWTKVAWLDTKADLEETFRKWGVTDFKVRWSEKGGTTRMGGTPEERRVVVNEAWEALKAEGKVA